MRRWPALALTLVACGPNVSVDDGDGDGSTTGSAETSITSTDATTPTTVDPTIATSASTDPTTTSTSPGTDPSTSTTSDGEESSTEDDGASYIQSPDGGGSGCPYLYMSWCDVWQQDCARGEKCTPWGCNGEDDGWHSTRCEEIADDAGQPGESCTVVDDGFSGQDDCDITGMCWNPDPETLVGHCVAFCSGSEASPTCADPASVCVLAGAASVCLPSCNPLASACAEDEECIYDHASFDGGYGGVFACMVDTVVEPQAYGDDCTDAMACGTGLVCRSATDVPGCRTEECCTTLGDANAPPACPAVEQTCLPLHPDGDAPPGLEDLCFCGVAP